jgi:membrane fusion protein (multidrug efflux system)
MKPASRKVIIGIVIVCVLAAGYWFYSQSRGSKAKVSGPNTSGPVATVKVIELRRETISAGISAYGEVVPAPGAIRVVSVPYESQVRHVMVSSAQKISKGERIIEIGLSPDTSLRLDEAQNDYEVSREGLKHMKELFELKLATNNQLLQARQKFEQADLRLKSLKQRGVKGNRVISAGVTGLVHKVYVQDGTIVPAGNPLLEIVAQDRLEVRLGVESGDAARLSSGRQVSLYSVNKPAKKAVTGSIRKISQAVNPSTRLVDVFVSLPGPGGFLLGEYVVGSIQMASSYGMVVPRSAVLPEKGKHVLYTVRNRHAVRHVVKVGIESGNRVEVSGGGLKPGDSAVILGNYELKDGMAVKMEKAQ